MNLEQLHSDIRRLEEVIHSNGLDADVTAYVNFYGSEIHINVVARESYDERGYWRTERAFAGDIGDAERLSGEAFTWAYQLPKAEDRASELMIQRLNEMASKLPSGGSDIAEAAWREIHRMLTRKAEQIAKNGLPSPARIQQLGA